MSRLARLLLVGTLAPASAGAAESRIHVRVAPDACPSAALVGDKLRPLLSADAAVTIDDAEAAPVPSIRIADLGEHYTVQVGASTRDVVDAARNCVERARVAAVFIALNLRDPAFAAKTGELPTSNPPEARRSSAPRGSGERSSLGSRLFFESTYAVEVARAAGGVGAGIWWMHRPWRITLDAAALSPVSFDLTRSGVAHGSVQMLRVPVTLRAGPLWTLGPWEVEPSAGAALDILRLSGEGVSQPETQVRINPGVVLALQGRLAWSETWAASAEILASEYPRPYDVSVEPTGNLRRTPVSWLAVNIGLDWTF